MTIHRGGSPVQNAPFVETHEDLPEDQDPSPLMIAFNKSFGTFYRGELLSVGYEKADTRDGTSKFLTLWEYLKSWVKQEKEVQSRHPHHLLGLLTIWRKIPHVQHLLVGLPLKCLAEQIHELFASLNCGVIFSCI
jgi:hypothetical protein